LLILFTYQHVDVFFFNHGVQHTLRTWSTGADRGCKLAVGLLLLSAEADLS